MDQIKILKGYQNTSPETFEKGANVWFNGDIYNVLNFDSKYVDIGLIATSLSRLERYVGHTRMTVAQHSCMMAEAFILMGDVNKAFQAWGHDQAEAYLGDIPNPLKKLISELFTPIEEKIEKVIADTIGYKYPFDPEVLDFVDKNASQYEMVMMKHNNLVSEDYFWSENTARRRYIEMYHIIQKLLEYDKKSLVTKSQLETD